MESERMRCAFEALSDPIRLKIIQYLSEKHKNGSREGGHEGSTEEEICFQVAETSSRFLTITHHLYELEAAGLISIGRKDNLMICSLRSYMFVDLASELAAIVEVAD
jgi:DNA-binding transcriptional ArsR family regulator